MTVDAQQAIVLDGRVFREGAWYRAKWFGRWRRPRQFLGIGKDPMNAWFRRGPSGSVGIRTAAWVGWAGVEVASG